MPETPGARLRNALDELRRFRRKQASDPGPGHERFRVRAIVSGLMVIFLTCSYAIWSGHNYWYNDLLFFFASLGFWTVLAGALSPVTYPVLRQVFLLATRILRIPTILLFETRMHLLELILIVTLLGNVIGFIIAGTEEATAAETTLLCVFCSLLVLGGSAWGLWVATELDTDDVCERCALILGGVLIPAAVMGLIVGPVAFINGITTPVTVESLQSACYGLGTVLGSLCLFWIIRGYHARASGAFHMKEVRKQMGEAKGRPFPHIGRTTRRLVTERQDG